MMQKLKNHSHRVLITLCRFTTWDSFITKRFILTLFVASCVIPPRVHMICWVSLGTLWTAARLSYDLEMICQLLDRNLTSYAWKWMWWWCECAMCSLLHGWGRYFEMYASCSTTQPGQYRPSKATVGLHTIILCCDGIYNSVPIHAWELVCSVWIKGHNPRFLQHISNADSLCDWHSTCKGYPRKY